MYTGDLVAAASLPDIECAWVADTYCAYEIATQVDEFYRWETGTKDYNTQFFLYDTSASEYITFSKPQVALYQVPANTDGNKPYGNLANSKLRLHFEGFGELHVAEICVDEDTNEETDCSSSGTRSVPSMTIPDGSTVTIGGETKYVKALEGEERFKYLNGMTASGQGIDLGQTANLPAEVTLTDADDPSNAANTDKYPGAFARSLFCPSPPSSTEYCGRERQMRADLLCRLAMRPVSVR